MTIHNDVRIGHVHLTVADLERSLSFYRDILGFAVSARYGDRAVFLAAGGYHHHIGLNTWKGTNVTPPPYAHSGLYHFAILYPSRKELAQALRALMDAGYPLTGTADHGVSEALYLNDPDGIGVELYADRDEKAWVRNDNGEVEMTTVPLNIESLLAELT